MHRFPLSSNKTIFPTLLPKILDATSDISVFNYLQDTTLRVNGSDLKLIIIFFDSLYSIEWGIVFSEACYFKS